jgi:hypothetical protein
MSNKRILIAAFISAVSAFPLGGFIFGVMNCSDCGGNFFGRLLVGCVFAVLTPLSGGFPPRDEGGMHAPFNAWPHIVAVGVVVFGSIMYYELIKARRK